VPGALGRRPIGPFAGPAPEPPAGIARAPGADPDAGGWNPRSGCGTNGPPPGSNGGSKPGGAGFSYAPFGPAILASFGHFGRARPVPAGRHGWWWPTRTNRGIRARTCSRRGARGTSHPEGLPGCGRATSAGPSTARFCRDTPDGARHSWPTGGSRRGWADQGPGGPMAHLGRGTARPVRGRGADPGFDSYYLHAVRAPGGRSGGRRRLITRARFCRMAEPISLARAGRMPVPRSRFTGVRRDAFSIGTAAAHRGGVVRGRHQLAVGCVPGRGRPPSLGSCSNNYLPATTGWLGRRAAEVKWP